MACESYTQEWCCIQCGGTGVTQLEFGMHPYFVNQLHVRAHSLQCPGCDGNALNSLRLRTVGISDKDWKRIVKHAKGVAVHADHSENWIRKWKWLPWP